MKQLLQLTALEIRLYLRSRTIWLIGGLAVAAAFIPAFDVLLLQFAAVSAAARDKRDGFHEVLLPLPYNTALLLLARALAVFVVLLGLWLFMVPALAFLSGTEWLFNGWDFILLTFIYITVCLTSVALVFFAGLAARQAWVLYLIVGACWIVSVGVDSNLSCFPAWSKLFLFGHGAMQINAPSAGVGYFPEQNLLLLVAVFQIAVAVLLLLFVAARWMAQRGERFFQAKWLAALALAAVAAGFIASFGVWQELACREKGLRLGLAELESSRPALANEAAAAAELEGYRLALKLQSAAHRLEGTATLKLRPADGRSDVIVFTLRNYFTVEDVAEAASGEKLEWRRDGSRLAVRLPPGWRRGESLSLTIAYSGEVWEWFAGRWTCPNGPVNFIDTSFSLLRSGYAWYPVPGDYPLYNKRVAGAKSWLSGPETAVWAGRAAQRPAAFELTVDADTDNTVISNLEQVGVETLNGKYKKRHRFASPQASDVYLLSGPYCCEKKVFPGREGFAEVYSYRRHKNGSESLWGSLSESYLFFEGFLQPERSSVQAGKLFTVVEMPFFLLSVEDGWRDSNLSLTDTVLIAENNFRPGLFNFAPLKDMQASENAVAVLQYWWGETIAVSLGGRDGSIIKGLELYLFALSAEKKRGPVFAGQIKQNLLAGETADGDEVFLPGLIGGPVVRDVFAVLDTVRNSEQGEQAIRRVVSGLYRVYVGSGTVRPSDFAGAVEEAAAGMPPEKVAEIRQRLDSIARYGGDPPADSLPPGFSLILTPFVQ